MAHFTKHDLIQAFQEGNAYGYIAEHYWQMSREQLKDCLLEVLWHAADAIEKGLTEMQMLSDAGDEIAERWGLEEEEEE